MLHFEPTVHTVFRERYPFTVADRGQTENSSRPRLPLDIRDRKEWANENGIKMMIADQFTAHLFYFENESDALLFYFRWANE